MSAATRLRMVAGTLTASASIAGILSIPPVRDFILRHIGPNGFKYGWRSLAILLALLNLKNLPGFWHIRVLRGIIYQIYFQPKTQQPKHLFAPMITSSYNTLYDCDYNFHKSNSTYFGDLDVARAHFVGNLIRTGLARLNRGDEEGLPQDTTQASGRYTIALGAVSCFFQRQIEPLQSFEIYTRLLSWDRKWVYIVSHIVKKGAIKPTSYVLQPWRKSKRRTKEVKQGDEDLRKHIFATSVARYVFKKGRLTINPEIVLDRSRLLPTRPEGVTLPPRAEAEQVSAVVSNGGVEDAFTDTSRVSEEWTWQDMETERLRGLEVAAHFDSLSAAHNELRAGEVLGQYGDYW